MIRPFKIMRLDHKVQKQPILVSRSDTTHLRFWGHTIKKVPGESNLFWISKFIPHSLRPWRNFEIMKTCLVSLMSFLKTPAGYLWIDRWMVMRRLRNRWTLGYGNSSLSLYLFVANLSVLYLFLYVVLGSSLFVPMISSNSLTCLLFFESFKAEELVCFWLWFGV